MSLYSVQISGRQYQVEISGEQVRLNGKPVRSGLLPLDHPGLFSFTQGDHQREMYLHHQHNGTYAITTEGRQMVAEVHVENPHHRQSSGGQAVDDHQLLAPMPGVVLKVHVQQDELVDAGQLLVTLESMKMQMEFRAPFAGKVAQVMAKAGQKVEKNAALVLLDRP